MQERIRDAVTTALAKIGVVDMLFAVDWPTDPAHGDFAVNVALVASKVLGASPREIARQLVPHIQETLGSDVSKVEVAGAGFVNIFLSREALAKDIARAGYEGRAWGTGTAYAGKKVMIEYSNPNPFKEMHIGHFMSTVVGEAVSRIIENAGAHVLRDSYGGDVGPHVAKTLWALRKNEITDIANVSEVDKAYVQGSRAYEESETAKAEIDTLNQDIYYGHDSELMNFWRKAREVCLESFREIYDVLGTVFDYYFFESETTSIGMEVVKDALAKGVFEESEGAVIYKGEKKGLHTLVFVTSHGIPTYETKDVGLAFLKEERAATDEVIIVTGAEQIGHFNVFLAALEDIAPLLAAKTRHVSHGLISLTTGKMSSRKGNVITGASLLKDLIMLAGEKNEDPLVAQQVAVGAVKYMILKSATGHNIVFDPEKSLSLEGDSGPYLQYALVRARKILAYASEEAGQDIPETAYAIERTIIHFPDITARAAQEHAPQYITHYLTKLAAQWNSFYASEQVLGSADEAYKQKIARAFVVTMENGLQLLGIPTPETM